MQRFLVIRLSSIGDIVHALPAVVALAESFRGAEIHWTIETPYACLLEGNPFVHRIVKLDTLGWRRSFVRMETIEECIRSFLALREVSFDAAIDFQGLNKSGLIAWLSHSRERVGFAENWLREPTAGVFYTERVAPRDRRHIIEMNMALIERLGARACRWQFPLPHGSEDELNVQQRLESLGAPGFIVVNPGAGWKAKCWAPENYAQLIRHMDRELCTKILLTGSPAEEGQIEEILRAAGSEKASYFPSTIPQFIALVRRAQLFVGGDTGPLHLAAAVGTPIVALYSGTDPLNTPERNGPISADDIVLVAREPIRDFRGGRNSSYLSGVAVTDVLAAIRTRLERAYG